jgi:hypothetical protein
MGDDDWKPSAAITCQPAVTYCCICVAVAAERKTARGARPACASN